MKQYLAPLWTFILGMLLILGSTLFFPAIESASDNLQATTANISSHYWGFSWATGNVPFILFAVGLLIVLYNVAVYLLKHHRG